MKEEPKTNSEPIDTNYEASDFSSVASEVVSTEPEKEKHDWDKSKKALKAATISILALLTLRGGAEVSEDVGRAKDFITQSGYSIEDYAKDTYEDIVVYDGEKTVMVNTATSLEEIVDNLYGLEGKNTEKAVQYIEKLNKDNTDIFRNGIGEIGPDSKLVLPESAEAKSPIAALVEYAFGDNDEMAVKNPVKQEEGDLTGEKIVNQAGFSNELVDYTIQPGDSLWGIANRLCQEAGIKSDQEVIDTIIGYIKNINNKTDDQIEAGAKLKVPPNLSEAFKIANNTSELDPTS